ncbi:hypothetical protein Lalb_Chr21g0313161 [Lupinus albus]|uniref:Uncharacterized protein n=1 Tax=Lupinus albus TaxID=3870 RepID=A0A6A4NTG8_LUPAL|nr:hypothetical protein Lalb_Chr21g0313161 [Lupinus albus]
MWAFFTLLGCVMTCLLLSSTEPAICIHCGFLFPPLQLLAVIAAIVASFPLSCLHGSNN